jgi:hypothetical protein
MSLFKRLWAWNDRLRARDFLQQACEDVMEARLKFDEAKQRADRALQDAKDLEPVRYCKQFFRTRDPVHAGFFQGSADLFGITEPTRMKIDPLPLAAIEAPKLKVAA